MICCWLADGIPGLVLACTLVSIGDAFRSGADQALLYRTCVALGREGEFQRIEARTRAVHVIALAGLIVARRSHRQHVGLRRRLVAETLLCTMGGAIAYAMIEPPGSSGRTDRDATEPRGRIPWRTAAIVHSSGGVPRRRDVCRLVHSADERRKRSQRDHGARRAHHARGRGGLGAVDASAGGGRAHSDRRGDMLERWSRASHWHGRPRSSPATIALAIATGVTHPMRAAAIQRIATDGMRARAASAASACDMALSTIFLLLAGRMLASQTDRSNMQHGVSEVMRLRASRTTSRSAKLSARRQAFGRPQHAPSRDFSQNAEFKCRRCLPISMSAPCC